MVHLVKPIPNSGKLEFVHTGLEEGSTVNIWGVNNNIIANHWNKRNYSKN